MKCYGISGNIHEPMVNLPPIRAGWLVSRYLPSVVATTPNHPQHTRKSRRQH